MNQEIQNGHTYYFNEFDRLKENGEVDLDSTFDAYIEFIINRDPEKYGDFSNNIKETQLLTKLLFLDQKELRVELLKWTYLAMRIVDDICDSDTLLSLNDEERLQLVEEIYNGNYSEIPVLFAVMSRIDEITKILGFSETYSDGIKQIIHSMRYDLLRILDTDPKRTRYELEENFYKMDIHGTEGNSAILLGVDPNNTIEKVLYLGRASRIAYSLRDLPDDLSKRIINIPKEDLDKFDISDDDLELVGSMKNLSDGDVPIGIKKWIKQEIDEALGLLELHDEIFNFRNTLINPPLQWDHKIPDSYGSSLMTYVFKKVYKDEILKVLGDTQDQIDGLGELGLVKVNPSRLFSISESLLRTFTYYYAQNSWDYDNKIKQSMIERSNFLCQKYFDELEITKDEQQRYFEKSKNLSLMYLGFLDSKNYTQKQIDGCVKAGFLSCTYDVCSDWGKGDEFKEKFENILKIEVSDNLGEVAIKLFNDDTNNDLEDDGLDRGSVTMQFIGGCTGITNKEFTVMYGVGLEKMGRYLQMVDDIMDVEEDFEELEHNFLSNKDTREDNLEDFINFFQKRYFHKQSLLQIGINISVKKAQKILEYLRS